MAEITLQGDPINTVGFLPPVGEQAPNFNLVAADLSDRKLSDFRGKKVVLNIFPSIDTDVCATSVRKFNEEASGRDDTVVLCISADLPFAAGRFCGAEGLENVVTLSDFRNHTFGDEYGMRIIDGPIAGLLGRAVLVVDEQGMVIYAELVPEIAKEPNYFAAMQVL